MERNITMMFDSLYNSTLYSRALGSDLFAIELQNGEKIHLSENTITKWSQTIKTMLHCGMSESTSRIIRFENFEDHIIIGTFNIIRGEYAKINYIEEWVQIFQFAHFLQSEKLCDILLQIPIINDPEYIAILVSLAFDYSHEGLYFHSIKLIINEKRGSEERAELITLLINELELDVYKGLRKSWVKFWLNLNFLFELDCYYCENKAPELLEEFIKDIQFDKIPRKHMENFHKLPIVKDNQMFLHMLKCVINLHVLDNWVP